MLKIPGYAPELKKYKGIWGGSKMLVASMADIEANVSGVVFWNSLMKGGAFDICDYVDATWEE